LVIYSILRTNIKIYIDSVISIEESTFYYGGRNSILYEGCFLEIKSEKGKFKTTSLNEKEYAELRNNLKEKLKGKVRLIDHYQGEKMRWIYLVILNLPTIYLIYKIINI
jgi:23S rRNA A2030 N6-methylase RlmJ